MYKKVHENGLCTKSCMIFLLKFDFYSKNFIKTQQERLFLAILSIFYEYFMNKYLCKALFFGTLDVPSEKFNKYWYYSRTMPTCELFNRYIFGIP